MTLRATPAWESTNSLRCLACGGRVRDPADLNMDGVIGLIDRLLMGSAMVEFVPVTAVR